MRAENGSRKDGNRALHPPHTSDIGPNSRMSGDYSTAPCVDCAVPHRRGTPKLESGLVGGSVVESDIPGLPPYAVVRRTNFVSDFRDAKIFADIVGCYGCPAYVTDH
jgi:hypothetical protein